jgi:hypothetical protein
MISAAAAAARAFAPRSRPASAASSALSARGVGWRGRVPLVLLPAVGPVLAVRAVVLAVFGHG